MLPLRTAATIPASASFTEAGGCCAALSSSVAILPSGTQQRQNLLLLGLPLNHQQLAGRSSDELGAMHCHVAGSAPRNGACAANQPQNPEQRRHHTTMCVVCLCARRGASANGGANAASNTGACSTGMPSFCLHRASGRDSCAKAGLQGKPRPPACARVPMRTASYTQRGCR